jgi:hypothetical protein
MHILAEVADEKDALPLFCKARLIITRLWIATNWPTTCLVKIKIIIKNKESKKNKNQKYKVRIISFALFIILRDDYYFVVISQVKTNSSSISNNTKTKS